MNTQAIALPLRSHRSPALAGVTATILTVVLSLFWVRSAGAQIEVGSLSINRLDTSFTLSGLSMLDTRLKLLTLDNFGQGIVLDPIAITDVGTITATALDDLDVFLVTWIPDGVLSGAELSALADWVTDGGSLILFCDDVNHDEACVFFGRTLGGSATTPATPSPGKAGHPLFDGPFGMDVSIETSGFRSYFASTVGAIELARDAGGNPFILEDTFGDGRLIFVGDVNTISNSGLSNGSGIFNVQNDIFLGNLIAYAADARSCPADTLCLRNGRFHVTVEWETASDSGVGNPVFVTSDTGSFTFFDLNNLELMIKVVNGCAINTRFWMFAAGLTNVKVDIKVVDTFLGITRNYSRPLGQNFVAIFDTGAFPSCL